METKAISQQPTLLPSFGYFVEPGTAAHAWHYGGVGSIASGAEQQQDVVLSVSADFDKDVLGQYIHKIYCRDCCRSAEERQQQHGGDASQGQRANGSSAPSTLATGAGAASSKRNWDQQQQEEAAERQHQHDGSSALSPAGSLLLSSLFPMDAANAATAAFVGLDKEKNKESLKRKLLLRRSAGELPLDQEKRLPQKSPPLFAQQRKHLQRAQNTANHRRSVNHEGCSLQWPVGLESVMSRQAALETESSPAKRPRAASRCDSGGKEQSTEQLLPPATDVLGDPTTFGERLLARSEVEKQHTHSPIEGSCIASGFTGEPQLASDGLVGCDVASMHGYEGDGIECADDGSACMRLEIEDASGSSRYLERSDNYSMGGSHSCCSIRPDGAAAMDSPDEPELLLTASSSSSQQHGWQEGSPSLATNAESCCLADREHCCNQKAAASCIDSTAASVTDASVTAGTVVPSGLHMIAAAATSAASSGGTIMPVTSSLKLHNTKTSSNISCSNVGSGSGGSSSNSNSKKAKPKAHTKTKVIKFHEYKGPPQQSSTSSASKVAVGHPSPASAVVRSGAAGVTATSSAMPSTIRVTAATAAAAAGSPTAASTSDNSQATAASAAAAGTIATGSVVAAAAAAAAAGNESSKTADSSCSAINAEMARYHLMLRQQQLFLQWQLEVQQKSMPLLVPMVQTPPTPSPPPSSSRHTGAPVVIAAATTVQTQCPSAQRSTAASPAAASATSGAATAADVASAFAQLQAESQQPKVDGLSNHTESTQASGSSVISSGANSSPSSSCSATLPTVHAQSVGEIAVPAISAADATPSEYIAMPSIRIIQDSLPHATGVGPALGMSVQLLSQQQLLPPLSLHNCKDDATNRLQPNTLEDMKIVELKAELKQRGLPVSGSKQQLIKRLLQSQQQQQQQNDGAALTVMSTGAAAVSASASCSPLSAPSTLSLNSPPSTPPGISSHCDDGYLQMLSISTASSSSSLAAAEEEERTSQQQQQQQQPRGSSTAFISASTTVHEDIVRQQQRQIEELQKMLHESRLQLSTQQLQTGAGATRKERKSPKKSSGTKNSRGAAAVTSGGSARGSAAGPLQRPGRAAEDAVGSSCGGGSSGRATPAASHPRQSTRSPTAAAAASARLPQTMPVLHRSPALYTAYSPGHHVQASLTAAVLSPSATSTSPPASLSEHFTGSADELSCLSLQSVGISSVPVGPPPELDSMVLSTVAVGSDTTNATVAATTAGAVDMVNCEETSSGGSPCSAASSEDLKANARSQVDTPPTATTMDDVLEMLIAATPDLIESISDPGEGATDHSSAPQGTRLNAETLIVSAAAQCYTLAPHILSSNISEDVRHRFEQQCGRVGGILSQHDTSTVSTVDATEIVAAPQRAASPSATDWSELVGGSYFQLDDDDDCRSASAFNRFGTSCGADGDADSSCDGCSTDRGRKPEDSDARRLHHMDDATSTSLSLDDFDANLNALEFKDEGGGCSSSSAGTLDWLDVVMHQQGSVSGATSGTAASLFPLGFQSDPLLTSHPAASMADLFTMDDADFGMLSEFGCGISWEKLHEVTTA